MNEHNLASCHFGVRPRQRAGTAVCDQFGRADPLIRNFAAMLPHEQKSALLMAREMGALHRLKKACRVSQKQCDQIMSARIYAIPGDEDGRSGTSEWQVERTASQLRDLLEALETRIRRSGLAHGLFFRPPVHSLAVDLGIKRDGVRRRIGLAEKAGLLATRGKGAHFEVMIVDLPDAEVRQREVRK